MPSPLFRTGSSRVGGILVPFTSASDTDAYQTWFDAHTDYALDLIPSKPLLLNHLLDRPTAVRAGLLDNSAFRFEREGLYAEAELDLETEDGQAILALVNSGHAFWSSQSLSSWTSQRGSYISRWPIVEGSVTPNPASKRSYVTVHMIRSLIPNLPDGELVGETDMSQDPTPALLNELSNKLDALAHKIAQPAAVSLPPSPAPRVEYVRSQYDNVSILGMAFWDEIRRQTAVRTGRPHVRTEEFMRALSYKVAKQVAADDEQPAFQQAETMTADGTPHVSYRSTHRVIDPQARTAWGRILPNFRADEAMYSTQVGFGDELVPTLFNSAVYFYMRMDARVFPLFETFQMPSNPYAQSVMASGPALRRGFEAADSLQYISVGSSTSVWGSTKVATSLITWTALQPVGAVTLFSRILLEDARVDLADSLARMYTKALAEGVDHTILNGHEATGTTNINSKGVAPATSSTYLVMDGLRKMALIDNAGAQSLAQATLAWNSPMALSAKMGTRGRYGRDLANLVIIADLGIDYALSQLAEFKTLDLAGPKATIFTGQTGFIGGIPVVTTDQIALTDATGQIDAVTPANNTKGSYLLVWRPGVKIGMVRDIETTVQSAHQPDDYFIYGSFRMDIQRMEPQTVACGYNTTVIA